MNKVFETGSFTETMLMAEMIGRTLKGGEVIELVSDVGGGKTAFVRGLARGLTIQDTIQSPTFTISRIYQARDGLELHHFDFYRLQEAGVIAAELAESLTQPNVVVAIEWGEIVHDTLPAVRMTVEIKNEAETQRQFSFVIPDVYAYINLALNAYVKREPK